MFKDLYCGQHFRVTFQWFWGSSPEQSWLRAVGSREGGYEAISFCGHFFQGVDG